MFYSSNNIDALYTTVNSELQEVCNWFKCNKLSLNASKTNLMLIGTAYKTKHLHHKKRIVLDGCRLTQVSSAKFLGITIDENLTWKNHINDISKVCSRNVGVLNKVKHFLPKTSLYKLYCSLIMPYLRYGILAWGNATKGHLTKLFKIQKKSFKNSYE